MARTAPALFPARSSSRAEKIDRLADELATIRHKIGELVARKDELAGQLLTLVKREGTADREGKVRLATDSFTHQIVEAENVHISEDKLIELHVSAKIIRQARVKTPYAYVRSTPVKE